MPETSAGLLLYRRASEVEVWIGHMGGPFWEKKDMAAWSIPKGLYEPGEEPLAAALREFAEEIGRRAPEANYRLLGEFRQPSGKLLTVFTAKIDADIEFVGSNTFTIEWPARSGRMQEFAELDDAGWYGVEAASEKLVKGQRQLLDALLASL